MKKKRYILIMCRLSQVKCYYDQESYIIIQYWRLSKQTKKSQMIYEIKF